MRSNGKLNIPTPPNNIKKIQPTKDNIAIIYTGIDALILIYV
jgi:hypothetical protein